LATPKELMRINGRESSCATMVTIRAYWDRRQGSDAQNYADGQSTPLSCLCRGMQPASRSCKRVIEMKAGLSKQTFDAAALKQEFPGLVDPRLHYLDNAATAQMPEVVLDALRRFEVEARANVHEGMHRRARAATDAYYEARARVARFLHANSDQEIIFTCGTTSSINLLAYSFGQLLEPGD
jgi:hypothetical protein